MINALIYLFAFVLVLSIVVIIHEGGHFFVARRCGVKVVEFSIGFGKELFGWTDKKGTRWKVCAIPMGGYVKMYGDEDASSTKTSTQKVPENMKHLTFMAQPLWKRALIIFAGPGMNYLSAILILAGVIFCVGEVLVMPVVGQVVPDTPAATAGFMAKDKIIAINDVKVDSFQDIVRTVQITEYGHELKVQIERNGSDMVLSVNPQLEENGTPRLGIVADGSVEFVDKKLGVFGSLGRATQLAYETSVDTLRYLGQILFRGRSANDMRGPLGIAEASGDAMKGGGLVLLLFIVQLSIALGLINLLPIPVLDGGHLFFYAIEAVRGKPLSERIQNALLWGGVCVLMGLMIFTLYLDVPRIFERIFS